MQAPLAHLVEHLTLNQGVQGSSPWRRTNKVSVLWTKEPWGRCFFLSHKESTIVLVWMQAGLQDRLTQLDALTISENRSCEATEKQRSCGFELLARVMR